MRQSELTDYQSNDDGEPWRDRDTLERLYVDEGLTQEEVAERLDCGRTTVASWLRKYDIPTQGPGRRNVPELHDPELLHELYVDRGLSLRGVADEIGCHATSVARALRRHDIGVKTAYRNYNHAPFVTDHQGYERWKTYVDGTYHRVAVHKLVAVAEYGFDAVCGEEIHHKNEIRWDNRPDNIEVMSPADHRRLHAIEDRDDRREFLEDLRERGRLGDGGDDDD